MTFRAIRHSYARARLLPSTASTGGVPTPPPAPPVTNSDFWPLMLGCVLAMALCVGWEVMP